MTVFLFHWLSPLIWSQNWYPIWVICHFFAIVKSLPIDLSLENKHFKLKKRAIFFQNSGQKDLWPLSWNKTRRSKFKKVEGCDRRLRPWHTLTAYQMAKWLSNVEQNREIGHRFSRKFRFFWSFYAKWPNTNQGFTESEQQTFKTPGSCAWVSQPKKAHNIIPQGQQFVMVPPKIRYSHTNLLKLQFFFLTNLKISEIEGILETVIHSWINSRTFWKNKLKTQDFFGKTQGFANLNWWSLHLQKETWVHLVGTPICILNKT